MKLESKIEAILFWKAEPVTTKELASLLGEDVEKVETAVENLHNDLKGRGITLVQWQDDLA